MAEPVTEFACMALKPGVDVQAADSEGYKIIHNTAVTAVNQPGAQRVYYGLGIEDSTKVWFFLDWDTVEDHQNYQKSEAYAPIRESLKSILDLPKVFIKHASVAPFPPGSVLDNTQSAVTEILTLFFPADITPDAKAAAASRLDEFVEKALKKCSDFKGASCGWSVENDVPVTGQDDITGSMLVAFIGWPSVDAHIKFRETQPFMDNIALLRNIPSLIELGAFHVSCKSILTGSA